MRRVFYVLVLYVLQKGSAGDDMRVLGVGSVAESWEWARQTPPRPGPPRRPTRPPPRPAPRPSRACPSNIT